MKKRISLLLCFALLLSLTACGGGGGQAQTTAPTETTVPPTTTEPAPDAAQIYSDAAAQILAADSLLVSYTIEKEMTVGREIFEETEKVSLSLLNPNSEEFTSTATRGFTWGNNYYADFTEFYGEGNYYSRLDGIGTTCAMTAEEYAERYLPTVLLTPELYGTVELQGEDTIVFSDALGFEPWLDSEKYTLVEASGTAELTAAGALADCTYHVIYTQGGVTNELDISFRTRIGPVDVELPVDADKFMAVESAEATLAYERLVGLTLQAQDYVTNINSTIVIAAGGLMQTEQSSISRYGADKELAVQYDYDFLLTDLSGQYAPDSFTQQEIFKNGTYTSSVNGGAAQADRSVTASVMDNYLLDCVSQNFLLNDSFATISMTDLGAVSLMEFTFTEDFAKEYSTWICGTVYEDANLLNDLASDYRTETGEFYIGVDNATGLPTMLGITYSGVHTIDGGEYSLAAELTQTYSFATGSAYETVHGEPLPAEEPVEKAAPLLYRVTGANGEEMYLFGTIHVGDERMAYLPQELKDALSAADALAVEFDGDAFTEQLEEDEALIAKIQQHYFYTDGTTTSDHISDELLYQNSMELLKATGGYISAMEVIKPILIATTIENAYLSFDRSLTSEYGADNQLMDLARAQGKEILNVESAEAQISMLTGYSEELQELLLQQTMEMDPAEYQQGVRELYEMWCRGDEAELTAYLATDEADLSDLTAEELALYEEYTKAMSTERNAEMLEVAKGYLSGDKVVFYAVGLAHLLAEDGLVNTLRDAGYTVELIVYE